MRLTITIDLEKRDTPLYGARIKHALSGLLHQAHIHDIDGEYEYFYPASDYDRAPESRTLVTVTKTDGPPGF